MNHRPFITIKFAQSSDFYISRKGEQTWLTNQYSKALSHKLRSENHAILIGTNTALIDNPELTNRWWSGESPLRICIDKNNKIPSSANLFKGNSPTLIINESHRKNLNSDLVEQWTMPINLSVLLERLFIEKQIGRMIVEGGAFTIKEFLKQNLWDNAMIFTAPQKIEDGIKAPNIVGKRESYYKLGQDQVLLISNPVC